ncbi:DUF459 domain-containing protein [Parvibaculum sp.]|uniref:SGNH/GDSL hydrolase family protein n=1 Tax=Parvibaculum sp. TaxID=2024848 RepID=UPI002C85A2A8|nr:DUF459 domain-containing protein [Parvibaculum sp.]HUD51840.1 DUF459 domain-containing protein [Parvibaculum sp.]
MVNFFGAVGRRAGLALLLSATAILGAQAEPRPISPLPAPAASVTKAALAVPAPAATPAKPAANAEQTHYNVVIFGDSLGDGVWAGLYHVLHKDKRFSVIRKSRVATGFVRKDYYDWNDAVREAAADTKIDIAVVVMGTNDRQTIIENGNRYALFEPKWREVYEARVDDFTATLKAAGAHIYWVGLPVMRSPGFEADMENFSGIFEARAAANGIAFIPTHALAADEDGKYQAYGTDPSGKKRLLRTEDGIHFTMEGYELLAREIADAIRTDADGGKVAASTGSAGAVTAAVMTSAGEEERRTGAAGATTGYEVADIRRGRSDDWRWTGDAR